MALTIFSMLLFLNSSAWAATAGKADYDKGNQLYKQAKYQHSIEAFYKARKKNPKKYEAVASWKAALGWLKLKQCDEAKPDFVKALAADPKKGGASSKSKFSQKLQKCNFTWSEIENPAQQNDLNNSGKLDDLKQSAQQTKSTGFLTNFGIFSILKYIAFAIGFWFVFKVIRKLIVKKKTGYENGNRPTGQHFNQNDQQKSDTGKVIGTLAAGGALGYLGSKLAGNKKSNDYSQNHQDVYESYDDDSSYDTSSGSFSDYS